MQAATPCLTCPSPTLDLRAADRSALDMPPCRMRRRSFVPSAAGSFGRTFHAITVLGEKPHERPGSSACDWCTDTARCSRAAPEPGANEARRRKPGGLRYVHDTEPGGLHAPTEGIRAANLKARKTQNPQKQACLRCLTDEPALARKKTNPAASARAVICTRATTSLDEARFASEVGPEEPTRFGLFRTHR